MTWLLWKEYRQNRAILWVLLFLLFLPYFIWLIAAGHFYLRYQMLLRDWPQTFCRLSLSSIGLSQIAIALMGGYAIAGERTDRSAEFQAYLPIPRYKILAAKLLLTLIMTALIWLPNLFVYWLSIEYLESWQNEVRDIVWIAIGGVTFFGVAWFVSSILRSPAIAVCAGLVAPVIVTGGIFFIDYLFDLKMDGRHDEPMLVFWIWMSICLALAAIGFVVGTWIAWRRVEP
jgi:ABC-type transport system involved in multi-copper enzyme maturation permease subunit